MYVHAGAQMLILLFNLTIVLILIGNTHLSLNQLLISA